MSFIHNQSQHYDQQNSSIARINRVQNKNLQSQMKIQRSNTLASHFSSPKRFNFYHNKLKLIDLSEQLIQFKKLDQELNRENKRSLKELSLPVLQDNPQELSQKLQKNPMFWDFFTTKISYADEKVQRQRINIETKCVEAILREITNKRKKKELKYNKLKEQLNMEYRKWHNSFHLIARFKKKVKFPKVSKSELSTNENEQEEKNKQGNVKQQIQKIKKGINQKELQMIQIKSQLKRLYREHHLFLKKLLKEGYYRNDGIWWIFSELLKINESPTSSDMPQILDSISKSYLLFGFKYLKQFQLKEELKLQKYKITHHKVSAGKKSRRKSQILDKNHANRKSIQSLLSSDRLKNVYVGAKDYVSDLLKKQQWRKPVVGLNIKNKTNDNSSIQRQNQLELHTNIQKQRIQSSYQNGQKKQQVKKILFGTKIMIENSITKIE